MKKVIITGATAPKKEKARIDGKVSREFMTVTFAEAIDNGKGGLVANPFRTCSRNIWQNHSADGTKALWKQTPAQLQELINAKLAIPGSITTNSVTSYPVLGVDRKQNKDKAGNLIFAERYTAVVLGGEDTKRIFEAAGHDIVSEVAALAPAMESELQA